MGHPVEAHAELKRGARAARASSANSMFSSRSVRFGFSRHLARQEVRPRQASGLEVAGGHDHADAYDLAVEPNAPGPMGLGF